MSRLSTFFKDSDTRLGVFYPKHYLLAIFPNLGDANGAKQELHRAGRAEEDVIAASGAEVIQFAEDHLVTDGLWGMLMTKVSRSLGAEASYADSDLTAAKDGAAFVAVHCPNETVKTEAWNFLKARHPLAARYYSFGGIEHLVGEN